ncbi:MAG: amidohydrolase family protein [Acidimicrobiia bacterium]|nr:amidohydrolase family protein [Acidimicrobiia bacterium]
MSDIPTCLPPERATRRSRLDLPPGAVDCHTHIFDSRYPLSPNRGYTPPDSTLVDMLKMHSQIGIERVVFTQPSIYGIDNSAILDGMAELSDNARAIVALDMNSTDEELARLDGLGVRGVRLNLDNKGGMPVPLERVPELADRIGELGWHLEFLFGGDDIHELMSLFRSLSVPISIGHFGYMDATGGVDQAPFQALLELVSEGNTWVKLSAPNRLGVGDLPPWDEVIPLAHALIETRPDRMLWASDWPHPNKFEVQPNDADLIEQLELWAPDPEMRRKILVDNPNVLYRF